jgi:hypothetical protein
MQKVVTEWIKAQGETGAGLTDAQRSDGFRNALGTVSLHTMRYIIRLTTGTEIQETNYPWFSAMRELVEKRPNCIAVGLGHSRSDVDLSVFTDVLDEPVDGPEGEPGMDAEVSSFHGYLYLTMAKLIIRELVLRMPPPAKPCLWTTPCRLRHEAALPDRCHNLSSSRPPSEGRLAVLLLRLRRRQKLSLASLTL